MQTTQPSVIHDMFHFLNDPFATHFGCFLPFWYGGSQQFRLRPSTSGSWTSPSPPPSAESPALAETSVTIAAWGIRRRSTVGQWLDQNEIGCFYMFLRNLGVKVPFVFVHWSFFATTLTTWGSLVLNHTSSSGLVGS